MVMIDCMKMAALVGKEMMASLVGKEMMAALMGKQMQHFEGKHDGYKKHCWH
jgi:hypothetical protein